MDNWFNAKCFINPTHYYYTAPPPPCRCVAHILIVSDLPASFCLVSLRPVFTHDSDASVLFQIQEFRGPASTVPVPSAVGASLALEKVCLAMASMEEPVSNAHTETHTQSQRQTLIIVMKEQETELHI